MPYKLPESLSWTEEEDKILVELRHLGWRWMLIRERLPGRTGSACQARFKHLERQENKKNNLPPPKLTHASKSEYYVSSEYIVRVPEGDPYLQRLIAIHGNDKINRTLNLKTRFASESV